MSIINIDLSDTIASWRIKTNQISTNVGDLSLLTDSAASIIASINTLQAGFDSDIIALRTDVYGDSGGILDLSALNTTDKTSIISAINELDRRLVDVYNSSGVLLNT
jgi:phosphoglycerate-specific signal transduction histidine kinase